MPILALDLDGTLLEYRPGFDFEDHDALRRLEPVTAVVRQARAWQRCGYDLEIVTGRSESARRVTERQVESMLGPDVPVRMQPAWNGVGALLNHKVRYLRVPGIFGFVGDGFVDCQAAFIAGIKFWFPNDFVRTEVQQPEVHAGGSTQP